MYNNYILSFYGTIVDVDTNENKESLWSDLAVFLSYQGAIYTPDELKAQYEKITKKLLERNNETKFADVDFQDVIYLIYKAKDIKAKNKQLKFTAQVFRMLSLNGFKLKDGAKEFLEALKKADKKIYLLANAQRCFIMPELKMLGLKDYFDDILLSSDVGTAKPDPALFNNLIEQHDLKAKKSLVIGSKYDIDIKGADTAGLDTLLFKEDKFGFGNDQAKCTFEVEGVDFDKAKELILKS